MCSLAFPSAGGGPSLGPAQASRSLAPQPSPLPPPIVPPTQLALATPTPPPRPTATSLCQNNASFIEDLTIPDGTQVLPGEALDKRWSVSNSGSCDWGP